MKDAGLDSEIRWIGHRGSPRHFPENTLEGYKAVLEAGGMFIETDVQLTSDGLPFLYHDVDLARLSGIEGSLLEIDSESARRAPASYPEKFGEQFRNLCISPLFDLASLLEDYPNATAFIELKEESIDQFGIAIIADAVLSCLDNVLDRCVLISFDADTVRFLRSVSDCRTGWVIPEWSNRNRVIAESLQPQWLFCNGKRLPADDADVWQGGWEWAIYTINEPEQASTLYKRGFRYLETDRILDALRGNF